jgi:hypothetical protein
MQCPLCDSRSGTASDNKMLEKDACSQLSNILPSNLLTLLTGRIGNLMGVMTLNTRKHDSSLDVWHKHSSDTCVITYQAPHTNFGPQASVEPVMVVGPFLPVIAPRRAD